MNYYDYRLRLQVKPGTPQETTLKYLKVLSEQDQFDEKHRTLFALCGYWMTEALVKSGTSREIVKRAATDAILEMAYQMQQVARAADIDLEEIDIPQPVSELAINSHIEVRQRFMAALVSGGEVPTSTRKKSGTPKRSKATRTRAVKVAPELIDHEEAPPEIVPAKKQPASRAKSNGSSGFSTNLFG